MLYRLSQKGLAAAKGMVGEVDRAGGKGTKCLVGTYQIPRAVYHFYIHITYNLGNSNLQFKFPSSLLKDPIYHDSNECKEEVRPISRNLI